MSPWTSAFQNIFGSTSATVSVEELKPLILSRKNGSQNPQGYGLEFPTQSRVNNTFSSISGDNIRFSSYAPDGGYGWIIVFASFLTRIITDGISLSYGVLQSAVQEASGISYSTSNVNSTIEGISAHSDYVISVAMYSWLGSILLSTQFIIGPYVSHLTNQFGYRAVGIAGPIISCIGIFLSWYFSPKVPNIWALLICFGFINGIGMGMMYQTSIVIVGVYFEKRRSLATGINNAGGGVGSIIFPGMLNYVMREGYGWQGAFLLQAALALAGICFAFLYCPLPTKRLEILINKEESDMTRPSCVVSMTESMISLCKSPTFLIFAISGGVTSLGLFTPFSFIPEIAVKEFHMSDEKGVYGVTLIGVSITVSAIVFGYLADLPSVNALVLNNVTLTLGGIAIFLVPYLTEEYQLYIFVIIFGVTVAIFTVLRSILAVELMGIAKINDSFGLILLFMGFTTLIGNPIGGWLKDLTGSYAYAFYAAGSCFIISAIMCYPLQYISDWENRKKIHLHKNSIKTKISKLDSGFESSFESQF